MDRISNFFFFFSTLHGGLDSRIKSSLTRSSLSPSVVFNASLLVSILDRSPGGRGGRGRWGAGGFTSSAVSGATAGDRAAERPGGSGDSSARDADDTVPPPRSHLLSQVGSADTHAQFLEMMEMPKQRKKELILVRLLTGSGFLDVVSEAPQGD